MFRIGIDLGGTKIEGIVLDETGNERFRERIPTEQDQGYRHILDRIHGLYQTLVATVQGQASTSASGRPAPSPCARACSRTPIPSA